MKTILVIEDDQNVRATIKELLSENNYNVFTAEDGLEGIKLTKAVKPDLIICDIMMPNMSGYEVIKNLKEEKEYKTIPFIFLTAKAELNDFREGMDLGSDDYIVKPYRTSSLLKSIENRFAKLEAIHQETVESEETSHSKNEALTDNDRLFLEVNNKPQIIKVGDIICIKAEGEYSSVYLTSGSKLFVRKLMKFWESKLSENSFLRIHRSTIVNINYIEKIEKWYNRSYAVVLKNFDEKQIISQRYASKIKSIFSA